MTESTVMTGRRRWAALGVLTLAVTLLAIDGTVLALAVPSLARTLAPSSTELLWIGDIYSFALAGLLVTMGNVADRVGRKRLLLIGSVAFGLASLLAAFAPTAGLLIAGRALLGIAGATIMPSTLSLIRSIFTDPKERTRAIAVWAAGATGGAAVAPLLGGALLEHFWWGSVFLINIPVMVLIVLVGWAILPESRSETRAPIDVLSAVLSFVAIVPLVYAIKTIAKDGLSLPPIAVAVLGIVAAVLFVRRQRRLQHPLIDVDLFRKPAFAGSVAANSIAIFALSGLLFFFSQYLQFVRGYSPLVAGLAELPLTIAAIVAVVLIGFLVSRLGRGRAIGGALLVSAAGLVGLSFAEELEGYMWMAVSLAVIGVGVSVAVTAATDAIVTAAPRERSGAASSISETGYELGVALGIAVLGSVLNGLYRTGVSMPTEIPGPLRAVAEDSLAGATEVLAGSFPAALDAARVAFTDAMQATSLVAAGIVAIAGIVAFLVIPAGHEDDPVEH